MLLLLIFRWIYTIYSLFCMYPINPAPPYCFRKRIHPDLASSSVKLVLAQVFSASWIRVGECVEEFLNPGSIDGSQRDPEPS